MPKGPRRVIKLEELGAWLWVNHNPRKARKLDITSVTFDTDAALTTFCAATEVSQTQLQEWGRTVRTRGYTHDPTPKLYDPGNGKTGWLLRRVRDDWRLVDGTMPQTEEDTKNRYTRGTTQGENTCAIDATIFCALRLDAGRTRIDQLPLQEMLALPLVSMVMRSTISKYWGTESLPTRNKMRDNVLKVLVDSRSEMHAAGRFQDVKTVVQHCLADIPQLSYTTMRAESCCDEINHIGPNSRLIRRHFLEVSPQLINEGHSLAEALSVFFDGTGSTSIINTAEGQCSRLADCNQTLRQPWVVIDRMPPILMVGFPQPITPEREKTAKVFELQDFDVHAPEDRYHVAYRPIGCIVKHLDQAHFTARWRADRPGDNGKEVMYYDGNESDKAESVQHWWSGSPFGPATRAKMTRKSLGPVVMFYEKFDPRERMKIGVLVDGPP